MRDATNPDYYKKFKYETIEVIEAITQNYEGLQAVCVGNVVKYVSRAIYKNGTEDIRKAKWYLKKFKETCGSYDVDCHMIRNMVMSYCDDASGAYAMDEEIHIMVQTFMWNLYRMSAELYRESMISDCEYVLDEVEKYVAEFRGE